MSGDLINFQNDEFGETNVLIRNGDPWFIGKETALKLGYKNTRDALNTHVDSEDKEVIQRSQFTTLEIPNRGLTIINESGLYSLILGSKLPTAKKYKKWVTSKVLPSIHRTGQYSVQDELSEDALLAKAVLISDKKIKKLENQLIEQKPKINYYEDVLKKSELAGIRETSVEFGIGQKKFIHYAINMV